MAHSILKPRIPLILSLFTFVSGCAGIKTDLPDAYVVESDLNYGVVVGSVGSVKPLPKNKRQEVTAYLFHSTADQEVLGSVVSAPYHELPFNSRPVCAEDGLPDECGILFAKRLPVGEYEFFVARPAIDTRGSEGVFSNKPWDVALDGYQFVVKPAQVTYLGNLLSRICSSAGDWFAGARSAVGDVADMYDRDVALLRGKFPQLRAAQIENETIVGKPWFWAKYKGPQADDLTFEWPNSCSPTRDIAQGPPSN